LNDFYSRINIGNIFLRSKQYAKALKMYRMALDQIPEQNADLKYEIFDWKFLTDILVFRFKVRGNIASTHILMGQFAEAAQAYESIIQERPNYRSSLNLLLCYHTLGQRDKTRKAFTDLLKIPFVNAEDDYQPTVSNPRTSFIDSIRFLFLD
jgi:intraflagellar transport protein 88